MDKLPVTWALVGKGIAVSKPTPRVSAAKVELKLNRSDVLNII
jgi:hypothetical protein